MTRGGKLGKAAVGLLVAAAVVLVLDQVAVRLIRGMLFERQLHMVDETASEPLGVGHDGDAGFDRLPAAVPFEEIDAFDDEAHSWSISLYAGAGVAVFDADGDGRLDVYLCHDGQSWTRPTDADGVLVDEPRYHGNTFYKNLGTDDRGRPIFRRLDELVAAGNRTYAEAELLIEDHLFPRRGPEDSPRRRGRASNLALAADFDGDGRPDLLVGNSPPGMLWSHPKTQRVLPRFVSPVGRQARKSKTTLGWLGVFFLKDYVPRQSIFDGRDSARGVEPQGANSLYLNLGDRDGDGLPEWQDASRRTGIEGSRNTHALAAADVDLDGDLDVFVANAMDMDYWPGGATGWAGGANRLYLNQLAETGELAFVERSAEMDVDGVFDEENPMPGYLRLAKLPLLRPEYSLLWRRVETYRPDLLEIDGVAGEPAEISWGTVFQDVDLDGYPDLWVANDLGYLRLYRNLGGERFAAVPHARSTRSGNWMTFAAADLDGDLREDLVAGNLGGSVLNHAFVTPDPTTLFDPVIGDSVAYAQFFAGRHDSTHAIVDGRDPGRELPHRVRHSRVLPPDTSLPGNVRRWLIDFEAPPFEIDTLDPYEFAWGMTAFDAQNDGRTDFYFLGCLYGRGGGLFPVMGTGPGRFLVNATPPGGELRLVDLTAEHHLFDIEELRYDRLASDGYVYRSSPSQNWRKRDVVTSQDRSTWVAQGPRISERITNHDLTQTAEHGRAAVAADFDGDGFEDLLITNLGGYDSRRSTARNLRARIDGRPRVVPAPDFSYPTLSEFDPGRTRLFRNRYREGRWITVRLIDDSPGSFNRQAVGARAIVDGRLLRVQRAGGGGFIGNVTADLHFGLGAEPATGIVVHWPDRERSETRLALDRLSGGLLVISKTRGLLAWHPAEAER